MISQRRAELLLGVGFLKLGIGRHEVLNGHLGKASIFLGGLGFSGGSLLDLGGIVDLEEGTGKRSAGGAATTGLLSAPASLGLGQALGHKTDRVRAGLGGGRALVDWMRRGDGVILLVFFRHAHAAAGTFGDHLERGFTFRLPALNTVARLRVGGTAETVRVGHLIQSAAVTTRERTGCLLVDGKGGGGADKGERDFHHFGFGNK